MARGALPSWNTDGRRAERRDVQIRATLREPASTKFEIDVKDLSVSGFRFTTASNLKIGGTVWVTFPGMAGLEAQVMWREGYCYGCAFAGQLHYAVLDHINRQFRAT